ncbi:Rib/alpha-like domain-containing protein [Facklamia sp. 7083-14-GEN3]|uniref:Rib/alpha-like domain-containing protein n=1 Tax=Facklamia sp. 7083-14-GEN3 TaxID=2973478 RepID=UPI00215CFD90|nr:Rib/alpha-like domain-containing protein [Facklamia sp. 7083-14-GEN3]MCR8969395.1 Rib/alpha-like domain-containing protein [Facklamia sp. 7083-14-GEN3]
MIIADYVEDSNYPGQPTFEDVTPEGAIDFNTAGKYISLVKVTYPDGSSEIFEVEVIVSASDSNVGDNNNSINSPSESSVLPKTGESDQYALFTGAALSILSGLGLVVGTRKKEEN